MYSLAFVVLAVGATQAPKPPQAPPMEMVWVVTDAEPEKPAKPTVVRTKSNSGCPDTCTCPCTAGGECTCLTWRGGKVVRVGLTWLPGYGPPKSTARGCSCGPNCACGPNGCGCVPPTTRAAPIPVMRYAPPVSYPAFSGGFGGGGFGGGGFGAPAMGGCGPGG